MAYKPIDLTNPPARANTRLDKDTAFDIAALALEEKRTFSAMVRCLLEDALKARALNDPTPF